MLGSFFENKKNRREVTSQVEQDLDREKSNLSKGVRDLDQDMKGVFDGPDTKKKIEEKLLDLIPPEHVGKVAVLAGILAVEGCAMSWYLQNIAEQSWASNNYNLSGDDAGALVAAAVGGTGILALVDMAQTWWSRRKKSL